MQKAPVKYQPVNVLIWDVVGSTLLLLRCKLKQLGQNSHINFLMNSYWKANQLPHKLL